MSQVTFASDATPALPDLDANFSDLYDLRELISTPGYSAATTRLTYSATLGWGISNFGSSAYSTLQATNDASVTLAVGASGSAAAGWSQGLAHIGTLTNNNLDFGTNNTWRARLDTNGNFLLATTSTTPNPGVVSFAVGAVNIGNNAGADGHGFMSYFRSGVSIGAILQSGTTAVIYATTSDERLKTNIVDAPESGAVIDAVRVRSFGWVGSDDFVEHGLVAQELVTVAPQAVKVGDDGDAFAGGAVIWGVDASKLVPLLVKELQSVRARLLALESAP
jgi:hypothetical protein